MRIESAKPIRFTDDFDDPQILIRINFIRTASVPESTLFPCFTPPNQKADLTEPPAYVCGRRWRLHMYWRGHLGIQDIPSPVELERGLRRNRALIIRRIVYFLPETYPTDGENCYQRNIICGMPSHFKIFIKGVSQFRSENPLLLKKSCIIPLPIFHW